MNHAQWKTARERALAGKTESAAILDEREQIRLALALGQLVYNRRTELGLSEADLASRMRTNADEIEDIELGGFVPVTTDLLLRLASALDVSVDVHLKPPEPQSPSQPERHNACP